MKLGITLVLCAVLGTAHAAIYRSVDADGVVHFDDQATPGSKEVKLHEIQTYQAPKVAENEEKIEAPVSIRYKSVTISQPADKDTVRNNDGSVVVAVNLDPELQQHHKVQIFLDGQPAGDPQTVTTFSFKDIFRGTHQLVAKVLNGAGTIVGESPPTTFTMHRPMVQQDQTGDSGANGTTGGSTGSSTGTTPGTNPGTPGTAPPGATGITKSAKSGKS